MVITQSKEHSEINNLLLKSFCILLGIGFAIQDVLILGRFFGPSAASIGGMIILLAFVASSKAVKAKTLHLYSKEILIITAIVTLIFLPTQESMLYGEIVWLKAVKVGLSVVLLLISLKYGQIFQLLHKELLSYVAHSYVLTIYIGVIFEKLGFFSRSDTSFIHYTHNFTQRPRGFATEPSTLAYSLTTAFTLIVIASVKRNSWRRNILLFSVILSGFLITTSRGFLGSTVLAIVSTILILTIKKSQIRNVTLVAGFISTFIVLQSIFFGVLLRSNLWSNFSRGTSDATREVWAQVSISGLSNAPIGAGFQGLITAAPVYLKEYVDRNAFRFSNYSLRELYITYSQSTDFAISPKNITSLFIITSGIFGLMFIVNIIIKNIAAMIKNAQIKFWESFSIFLVMYTLLNYAGGMTSFAGFFTLGVIIEKFRVIEKSSNDK